MKGYELKDSGQKNRFYRLRRAILSGVPEFPKGDRVHIVEISMRGEREYLIVRHRHIKARLAQIGLKYENCFCAPVEPIDGFYQLKGLIRLEKYMSIFDLEAVLQGVWSQTRGGIVKVLPWVDVELRNYMRNSMLSAVAEGKYKMKHLVRSRGWALSKGAVSGSDWFHIVGEEEKGLSREEEEKRDRWKSLHNEYPRFSIEPDYDS